jgi:hypothetical protein
MIENRNKLRKEISEHIETIQETNGGDDPSIKDQALLKTQELVLNAIYLMLDDNKELLQDTYVIRMRTL